MLYYDIDTGHKSGIWNFSSYFQVNFDLPLNNSLDGTIGKRSEVPSQGSAPFQEYFLSRLNGKKKDFACKLYYYFYGLFNVEKILISSVTN